MRYLDIRYAMGCGGSTRESPQMIIAQPLLLQPSGPGCFSQALREATVTEISVVDAFVTPSAEVLP